jgi:multidrug efflux pump subunit AcrA (membrane-fusion protein)
MQQDTKMSTSTKVWTIVTGVLVVALLLVGGMLVFSRAPWAPAVQAEAPLNLPAYQPAADRAPLAGETTTAVVNAQTVVTAPVEVAQASEGDTSSQNNPGSLTYAGDIQAADKVPVGVEVNGKVLQLNVKVGDFVQAGDLLLQIDSTTLEVQRAQAIAGLKAAQAQLDGLNLAPDAGNVEAARASVGAANASYQKAVAGPTQQDLDIAEAQLRQAQAAVKQAQAAYDQVSWAPNIGALPQSAQLEQATLQVEAAQAQYDKITQGATQDVIDGAYAQVAAANAQLSTLQSGAKQPQLDAAQAQIDQAETALYLAQIQLDKATVRAPIDGVISVANTAAGANVSPGAPVFEILSKEIEIVISVEETRVPDIYTGQPATISVSAYPGRTFTGEIETIAPALDASTRTVKVTIRPTGDVSGIVPGMYATVELAQK